MDDLFHTFPALIKEFAGDETLCEKLLAGAWRRIVGEDLSERTEPLALGEKRLVVAVETESWRKNMTAIAGQMVFKINSALGHPAVTFIEFVVDANAIKRRFKENASPQTDVESTRELALDEVSGELRQAAEAIKDDELRYKFLITAGTHLIRKKSAL